MKIAMPVQGGKLSQHFGHSEQFSLFEIEDQSIRGREDVTPPPHEPTMDHISSSLHAVKFFLDCTEAYERIKGFLHPLEGYALTLLAAYGPGK